MKTPSAVIALASLFALSVGGTLSASRAAGADVVSAGTVSFLMGEATRTGADKTEKLAVGSQVYEGDLIETRGKTRLEIKLPDESALRIGPQSKVQMKKAAFGKTVDERKVNAKLVVGNVWAKVAHAVGGDSRFEVQTESAVAGVRGTTFRVDAKKDRSCVVKVYAGTVAVAGTSLPRPEHGGTEEGKPSPKERKQVPGPQQITREQWEKMVGAMMQVRVSANGVPSDVEPFRLAAAGEDEWEQWNQERDQGR